MPESTTTNWSTDFSSESRGIDASVIRIVLSVSVSSYFAGSSFNCNKREALSSVSWELGENSGRGVGALGTGCVALGEMLEFSELDLSC